MSGCRHPLNVCWRMAADTPEVRRLFLCLHCGRTHVRNADLWLPSQFDYFARRILTARAQRHVDHYARAERLVLKERMRHERTNS